MSGTYQHNLLATGAQRLKLLARYANTLMHSYAGAPLSDADFSDAARHELLAARLLWRSEDDGSLRLSHRLRELIAEMIADERRRHTQADVAESLDRLRTLATRYLGAQNRADYAAMNSLKQLLIDAVDDFNSRLADAIDSLWQRLNSDFGFVHKLEDKIAENERARKQVQRLLDGLKIINFDEWIELAGSHGFLRRLLVSQWQQQISTHYQSLRNAQQRLTTLMARFRQQRARARLVRGMAHYLRTHMNWQPTDHAHRSQLPELLNQAEPLAAPAFADLGRDSDQQELIALLARLPKHQNPGAPATTADPVATIETPSVALLQRKLKQAAEDFVLHVADQRGHAVSAMAWWHERGQPFDAGIWLLQILAEYEGLPSEQRQAFALQTVQEPASHHNQLYLVRDYVLKLNISALIR